MHKQVIGGALLMLGLSACNLNSEALPTPNEENIIYVTATPALPTPDADGVIYVTTTPQGNTSDVAADNQAQTVNDVPTAILPSTEIVPTDPPATPTVSLADVQNQVAEAEQYLANGYFESSVQTFNAVVAQGDAVPDDVRAEAAFNMGRAALSEGLFQEAVDALTVLIEQLPDDGRVAQAHFLRGDAYSGLSLWQNAIADYQQYLALRPGMVDSYAHERIADAFLAEGQLEAAISSYDSAVNAGRLLVPTLILREKLAQIYLNNDRIEEAIAQYDAVLAVAQLPNYRAAIDFAAAQALMNAGDTTNAIIRARRIFENYPQTTQAYPAMQMLLDNGADIDGWQRGRVAYYYGDYSGAIEAFNDYSSSYQLDAIPAELYLMLGLSYREIGNSDAAVVAFQTLIEQYPDSDLFGEALLEQGRTRFLAGDIPAAIEAYMRIAQTYDYLEDTASEALWRVGYLYGTNGDPVNSREVFTRLATTYPDSEWAANGLTLAASAAVTAEQWDVAENLYGRIANIATGEDQAAAYLWVGRLAQQRGDNQGAEQAFNMAIQAAPDSYFAQRAQDIRNGQVPFTPPEQISFEMDEAAGQAEAEAWLREVFPIEGGGSLSRLSNALTNDPRVVRGQELTALSVFDEAEEEFTDLLDELRTSGNALGSYQMAIYLRDLGLYRLSIVAAADVITAANVATLDAPEYIARMRYPAYYSDLIVSEAAGEYDIDPLLMLSLIRQESLFDAHALSAANAYGLTQVIPSTGQYIAQNLGEEDWQVSDLLQPYVSIRFGSHYLAEQLRLFDGSPAPALAAYNGGPGNALDWNALAGGEVDLLLTTITFEETKNYVQRIYSHYNIYRALYGMS
ncbi:tetratricopeptide repeat protein [Phototrophicus methaneseepsis]|uniref:Tetratricopeptide repeat protein n=1 Tax=Phototrophicus methaneseepsis TaxID=2710758 RepID=A0A7S8E7G3_9CHLR|nr:tetratricopeptide repeat protein [Phototrophicus methaneseepsis]QPC81783.1 tetratricopeptide repeat protein [Phototrophicus methaneseepsis]